MKSLNRLSSFIKSQNAILLLCWGIAFVFWFTNKMSNNTFSITTELPIQYSIPNNRVNISKLDTTIQVDINTNGWECFRVLYLKDYKPVNIQIDSLQGAQNISRNRLLSVITDKLNLSKEKISSLQPSSLSIDIAKREQKKVPVIVDKEYSTPNNTLVLESNFTPDSITFFGSKEVLKKIKNYPVSPTIDKTTGTVKNTIPVTPYDFTICDIKSVTCQYEIDQMTEKEILVPVNITLPENYGFEPNKILFTCTTTLSEFKNVDSNSVTISIPLDTNYIKQHDTLFVPIDTFVKTRNLLSYKKRFDNIKIIKK